MPNEVSAILHSHLLNGYKLKISFDLSPWMSAKTMNKVIELSSFRCLSHSKIDRLQSSSFQVTWHFYEMLALKFHQLFWSFFCSIIFFGGTSHDSTRIVFDRFSWLTCRLLSLIYMCIVSVYLNCTIQPPSPLFISFKNYNPVKKESLNCISSS